MITRVLLLVSIFVFVVGAETTTTDCSSDAANLLPCFAFVKGTSTPSSDCCSSLTNSDAHCLCTLLSLLSTAANESQALNLPAKCGIQGLTPEQCKVDAAAAQGSMAPPPTTTQSGPVSVTQSHAPGPSKSGGLPSPAVVNMIVLVSLVVIII